MLEANRDEHLAFINLESNQELQVVELMDEHNGIHNFAVLATVRVEEQEYVMLAMLEELEEDDGSALEVFLFEQEREATGERFFNTISDKRRFAEVRSLCAGLMSPEKNRAEA